MCREDPVIGRGIYIDTEDRAWLIGFIDPLNQYDYTKKFEYYAKMPQHGNTMSCVPPGLYAPRFKDFMSSILNEDPRRFNPNPIPSPSSIDTHDPNLDIE
jgi:hypothetical protein